MKSFFKTFFAALLALFIFSLLGFFILIGIAATFSTDEKVAVAQNSVLVIDASEAFLEQSKNDPFSELMNKKNGKQPSLSELIGLWNMQKKILVSREFILSVLKIQMVMQQQRKSEKH